MKLPELLEKSRDEIISLALTALSRAHLQHYETSTDQQNRDRFTMLYDLTVQSISTMNLVPIIEYAHTVARERFQAGFDLQEVQTAFNVLEELIWKKITSNLAPQDYAEALGLVSTVLGAGKQALAVEYVSLAGKNKTPPSLDLKALFKGI